MRDADDAALTEKAREAEAKVGYLRVAVITVGSVAYPFLLPHEGTYPELAYAILAAAWAYALAIVLFKPYVRFPGLASPLYTTASDSFLLMLWIAATGGSESPFWAIMFLSLLAIAYRFSLRWTLAAWGAYSLLYVGVVVALGQWRGHEGALFVRVAYLGIASALAGLIATQSLEQGRAKIAIARVAETERRLRAEANHSLSLVAATLESTADGILVVDAAGRITSFNKRFTQLWRIPQSVLDAKSDEAALRFVLGQLRDPDGFLRKVQELYNQPLAESFDTLEFLDGRVFERYSRPQMLAGSPAGRVWSFRDVTERIRSEREREANRARAEELDRLKAVDAFKSQFINTAAHELNTPLTPILLQLHMLKGAAREGEELRGFEILERNVKRLSELVSDLLDAAKYQSGRLVVDRKPTDLRALASDCVESFGDTARRADIRLRLEAPGQATVPVDERRVTQVLYNLLSNAIKFTPAGGTVEVRLEGNEKGATIRVRDSGIGIARGAMDRLFLPFSQVHGAHHPGTGLGLYICRGIVESHGGRIWAESPGIGQGTTMAFTIPAHDPAAAPEVSREA